MYMPGRMRTGSRPSRTWTSAPVYLLVCAISVHSLAAFGVRERLNRDRLFHRHEACTLDDLAALATARTDLLRIGMQLEALAALLGLDREHIALHARDEADHGVVRRGLDHGDAATRAFELRDLVGLDVQDVTVARGGDDGVAVVS